ncbi:MAG: hypothetical protein AAFV54_10330 [Pseudomonadota bacterium]
MSELSSQTSDGSDSAERATNQRVPSDHSSLSRAADLFGLYPEEYLPPETVHRRLVENGWTQIELEPE